MVSKIRAYGLGELVVESLEPESKSKQLSTEKKNIRIKLGKGTQ